MALAAAAAAVAAFLLLRPGAPVEVDVPAGLSAAETAHLLKRHGVISSTLLFRAAAKFTGADRHLKPGAYRLRRHMGLGEVLQTLEAGTNTGIKVSVPEGFAARQIADRLDASGICRREAFLKYVRARALEGYLFPTTYFFEPGSSAEKTARRMEEEFKKRIQTEYDAASPKPKLTLHQMLTLASIVEREAVQAREKPMIAAVYVNRMRMRMRLEADPTVQYALGRWKKGLTTEDLKTPSPYNTYMHYGLPPGPICSPGVDSFRAALHPAFTDAIFFVADNTGGHVFSSNLDDHLKAKRSFKRGLRKIKEKMRRDEAARKMVK